MPPGTAHPATRCAPLLLLWLAATALACGHVASTGHKVPLPAHPPLLVLSLRTPSGHLLLAVFSASQAGQWASPLGPGGRGRGRGRRLGLALGTRHARALSLLLPGALGQKEECQHCRHHQPNTQAHLSHMHVVVQSVVSLPPMFKVSSVCLPTVESCSQ